MELKEKIKAAVIKFAAEQYGESEEDASYSLDALTEAVFTAVTKPEESETEIVKIRTNKQGVCPYCGGSDITYDTREVDGNDAYYPAHCNGCCRDFKEGYYMEFTRNYVGDDCDLPADDYDSVEMTATEKKLKAGRRILTFPGKKIGTIRQIDSKGNVHIVLDGGKMLLLDPGKQEYKLL